MKQDVYVVIMAGGAGTRFWPLSRRARPKQVLALAGDGRTPLIAATAQRVRALAPPERTIVVTARALESITRETLPELPAENILLEPAPRNTAPCVAWATAWVQRRDPNAVVVVLASDAFIADDDAFVGALSRAADVAREGAIVTLGITPTRAETGYGYLHVGAARGDSGAFDVRAFVEKPDRARAEQFLAGNEHLWNAGIFVYRADVMRAAVREFLPDVARGVDAFDRAAKEGRERDEVEAIFPTLTSVSIDVGVMEKVGRVAVVPASCGWNDVGSWQVAWELGDKDTAQNVVRTDTERTVLHDARGNIVVAPNGKAVAVIGVEDLVIVDTPDALLVVPRAQAQEVKRAVDALAARKRGEVL